MLRTRPETGSEGGGVGARYVLSCKTRKPNRQKRERARLGMPRKSEYGWTEMFLRITFRGEKIVGHG